MQYQLVETVTRQSIALPSNSKKQEKELCENKAAAMKITASWEQMGKRHLKREHSQGDSVIATQFTEVPQRKKRDEGKAGKHM